MLDLNGRLVASGREKEISDEKLVRIIAGVGVPVLVASDTSPPSHFVQKIAARFDVRVFSPQESLTKAEKRDIGGEINDPHIRDSYAAAVKAYRKYQNRLRQVERMVIQPKDKDRLKRMAIRGERIAGGIGKSNQ